MWESQVWFPVPSCPLTIIRNYPKNREKFHRVNPYCSHIRTVSSRGGQGPDVPPLIQPHDNPWLPSIIQCSVSSSALFHVDSKGRDDLVFGGRCRHRGLKPDFLSYHLLTSAQALRVQTLLFFKLNRSIFFPVKCSQASCRVAVLLLNLSCLHPKNSICYSWLLPLTCVYHVTTTTPKAVSTWGGWEYVAETT